MHYENLPSTIKANQKKLFYHLQNEQNKARFDLTINEEYTQKVILYGYVVVNFYFLNLFSDINIKKSFLHLHFHLDHFWY